MIAIEERMQAIRPDLALPAVLEAMEPVLANRLAALAEPCPPDEWEGKVEILIAHLLEHGDAECPHPYEHQFADGLYYRQVTKGPMEIVVGSRHAMEHQCILLSGAQLLFTCDGVIAMSGPCPFVGAAGGRKVTLTLTPVVFANVFANPDNCKDVEELERRLRIPERAELQRGKETPCLCG